MGVFLSIMGFVGKLLPALPNLIVGVEALFKGTPKSGSAKWIAVEQGISQSIQAVADQVVAAAPGTDAAKISALAAKYAKAVNDATVTFLNEAGVFQTNIQPTR